MKTEVGVAEFYGSAAAVEHLRSAEADLRAVGRITGVIRLVESEGPLKVDVQLVPRPPPSSLAFPEPTDAP